MRYPNILRGIRVACGPLCHSPFIHASDTLRLHSAVAPDKTASPYNMGKLAKKSYTFRCSSFYPDLRYTRAQVRSNLTFLTPPPSPLPSSPTTCIRFPLAISSFSYHFLLSLRRSTSHSAWRISRTTLTQPAAELTLKATQRVLRRLLALPTKHARFYVEETPRASRGGITHIRGFFLGWLSSPSSPLVLEATLTT